MQTDLNSLRPEILYICTPFGIEVCYKQLQDPKYLNDILLELSWVSHIRLSQGEMSPEDLKQFLDDVREAMNLKERPRRVKRPRYVVIIELRGLQIRPDIDDYEYLTVDSVPESVDYDADQFLLTLKEFIEMFGDCCGDEDDSDEECVTVEGGGETVENETVLQYREDNLAKYVDEEPISH